MIWCAEALSLVLEHSNPLPKTRVPLDEALGMALAEDLWAEEAIPAFNNSAMDGFAIRSTDLDPGATFEVIGTLPAGQSFDGKLAPGQALRIMTGAPIPEGADTVVPLEHTQEGPNGLEVLEAPLPGAHVRPMGSDLQPGALVLRAGEPLRPAGISILASLGVNLIPVRPRPRVGILSTGNELVPITSRPGPGQIRDGGWHGIAAQVSAVGALPVCFPRIPDCMVATEEAIRHALSQCDVLLTLGGVSVGDCDFVKPALEALGARKVFWRVAQKPGGPFAFWVLDGKPIFGLPGNPVSSMVNAEHYVRPALRQMMGFTHRFRPVCSAILDEDWQKETPDGKAHFLQVTTTRETDGLHARLTGRQGSAYLTSLLQATGIAIADSETSKLRKGDLVQVHMTQSPEDH